MRNKINEVGAVDWSQCVQTTCFLTVECLRDALYTRYSCFTGREKVAELFHREPSSFVVSQVLTFFIAHAKLTTLFNIMYIIYSINEVFICNFTRCVVTNTGHWTFNCTSNCQERNKSKGTGEDSHSCCFTKEQILSTLLI